MPMNNYTVGRDVTLAITTPEGQLATHNVTKFDSKQDTKTTKFTLMNGRVINQRFPDGWSGTMEVARADDSLDAYIAALEDGYYAGKNEQPCSITEIITEPDGSISEYQYTGVIFTLTNAGSWSGEAQVNQQLSFMASRRIKRV